MVRCLVFPLLVVLLVVLLAGAALLGCGDADAPPAPPEPSIPDEPEAALAWVREAAAHPETLRARLAAWPLEDEEFTYTGETQVALTWRIRLALGDGRVQDAMEDLQRLRRDYEGEGESPEGEALGARVIALGIFEGALRGAREAMEGARPDARLAAQCLAWAETLLAAGDESDRARLSGVRRLTTATEADSVPELTAHLSEMAGPTRVLAYADAFSLGEVTFTDVLARWQREGAAVEIVPVLRGQVRVGQRLVPAESEEAERTAIAADARAQGLTVARAATGGTATVPGARLEALGLGPQEVLILVLDGRERIVGRLAGIHPDLRPLDPVIQRLVSR